ncbi:MAG: RES family NAD+ phosphorylase [Opitutales bacterium]
MASIPEDLRLWRLVKTRHAGTAFDGEGAYRFGGRWNSHGQRLVYASGSLSLALLEILVHLDPAPGLPALSVFPISLPKALLQTESFSSLDTISGGLPWPLGKTRAWGDAWHRAGTSPALAVPSSIVPHETNYILNPRHHDFNRITIGQPQPFTLDARLG